MVFRLVGANDGLVGANNSMVRANDGLLEANNDQNTLNNPKMGYEDLFYQNMAAPAATIFYEKAQCEVQLLY